MSLTLFGLLFAVALFLGMLPLLEVGRRGDFLLLAERTAQGIAEIRALNAPIAEARPTDAAR
jgi:hypothetical protein